MTRILDDGTVHGDGALAFFAARLRHALLLVVACAFVAAGVFLLVAGDDEARWVGIAGIVFFGACALVFLWQLFDRRPRLIIDDIGVFDRTLRVGRIPWDEIEDASLASIQGQAFICLSLRDEARWVEKLPPLQRRLVGANRALGFSGLNLNLSGVDVDPSAVLALILTEVARRRAAPPAD